MMGSTEDPENGAAVAATVFSAVIVYVVRTYPQTTGRQLTVAILGIPFGLQFSGVFAHPR